MEFRRCLSGDQGIIPKNRTDMKSHSLTVASVAPETAGAVRLTMDIPHELMAEYGFRPGQYLTFEQDIDGRAVRRSYSICSVPGEPLEVGIKLQPGGRFSTYANRDMRAGETLEVATPRGRFVSTNADKPGISYFCIAAGSGITPILSIIRATLGDNPTSRATLLYGNKTTASMMFRHDLLSLKNRYLDRFHLIPVFSEELQDNDLFNGRIDNAKGAQFIKRLLPLDGFDEFYLCGPESMVAEVTRGLGGEGVPAERIHYELFAASAEDAAERVRRHEERARRFGGDTARVSVRLNARRYFFDLEYNGENILDRASAMGLDVPYACKDGVCATCKARVLEGRVEMDVNHALSEQEVADGYVLTCQSHPVSPRLTLDYDV